MTQLNLSGRQSNHPQQKSAAEPEGGSIKNQTVGALGALAMFAAVIVIGSCSRSSKPVAVQQPVRPAAPVSAPAVTTPAPPPTPVQAKAKTRKHRAATLSYVNREYGLSFNFPRSYRLKTGNAMQSASGLTDPAQMNFIHPGGVMLAAVEMPGNSYPGTDFKSGLVNVSVNPGMTSEACAQFALPEPGMETEASSPVKVDDVKIGAIEFREVENSGAVMKQPDARYYHVFSSGACYEFALGVGTDSDVNLEEITPVDRELVFGKLERILATVKFQPAVLPETQAPETRAPETQTPVPSVAATTPADSSTTTEHEATKPNL
jgi:hypothetical protein